MSSIFLYSGGQRTVLNGPLPWPSLNYMPGGTWSYRGGCDVGSWNDYEAIYRSQPNVRTVVSFLANNIAQVGLHTYRRVNEHDRTRVRDGVAATLAAPWPGVTQYRLIESLVSDLAIFAQAFWLKVARPDTVMGLLRVPPRRLYQMEWADDATVAWFEFYRDDGSLLRVNGDQVVWFSGYGDNGSPLEALRLLLAEDDEAAQYRAQLWKNGARIGGVLKRPIEAPEWSDRVRDRFKAEWAAWYTGDGSQAGGTPILEDGMDFQSGGFSAEQAQYLEARKLTMVQVAAAYHVPPPMVGMLEDANLANIKELHRSLYQDTLGPWFRMIEQEVDAQVVPDFPGSEDVYCEFNVAEKLRGSFEEQSAALARAVGAPYMTRAEARARMNLPEIPGAEELIVPLNVMVEPNEAPLTIEPDAASRRNGHHKTPSPVA